MSALAHNVRRLLAREGLTQAELAARAGIDVRTIKQIVAGGSTRPHPRTLHKLAGGLGVGTDELIQPAEARTRCEFDRATNPLVDEVLANHAQLCCDWDAEDFAELYSHFGTGGALTYEGVQQVIAQIQRKRATLDRAALLLETDYAELLAEFIDLLHRKALVRPAQTNRHASEP
jgi:transcriptional regulator with XRE-family HTH domain